MGCDMRPGWELARHDHATMPSLARARRGWPHFLRPPWLAALLPALVGTSCSSSALSFLLTSITWRSCPARK
jgi:hypothetical protein